MINESILKWAEIKRVTIGPVGMWMTYTEDEKYNHDKPRWEARTPELYEFGIGGFGDTIEYALINLFRQVIRNKVEFNTYLRYV